MWISHYIQNASDILMIPVLVLYVSYLGISGTRYTQLIFISDFRIYLYPRRLLLIWKATMRFGFFRLGDLRGERIAGSHHRLR